MKLNVLSPCHPKKTERRPSPTDRDLSRIEAAYDAVAGDYAREFRGEHEKKPMDQEMLGRFAKAIGGEGPVLDLGCGPGQTSGYLHGLGLKVMGMDLSGKAIAEAGKAHPDIEFRKGDMLELDLPDSSVAGIVSFYAIVHFSPAQVETAFREICRVLRPGGRLLLTFHVGDETIHLEEYLGHRIDVDFMFFATGFISRALQHAGLEVTEIIERDPYPGVEYQSRRAYVWARKAEE